MMSRRNPISYIPQGGHPKGTATAPTTETEEFPRFCEVPKHWQRFMTKCTERMHPSQWAGYRRNRKMVFVQVAYALWAHPEDEMPAKYRVYLSENDYTGKEVKSSLLFNFTKEQFIAAGSREQTEGSVQTAESAEVEISGEEIFALTKPKPNREEGLRYIEQAKVDLMAAKSLAEQERNFSYMACFLCQQVAEKALEGLVLARCGKFKRSIDHSWHLLKQRIKESEVDTRVQDELTSYVAGLEDYYLKTRYPDQWPDKIPAEHYSKEQATGAQERAGKVLAIATSNMPQ